MIYGGGGLKRFVKRLANAMSWSEISLELTTLELANSLDRFAYNSYSLVPVSHSHTISGELDNVFACFLPDHE